MFVRRIPVVLGVLALALALVPAVGAKPTAAERLAGAEQQLVREINRVRLTQGLRPLTVNAALRTAALGHTRSMLDNGFFEHESLDGTSAPDRIERVYPARPNRPWAVGETLFSTSGDLTARETVSLWLSSAPHRVILLSPQWREIGIGVARSPLANGDFGGRPTSVATADFGSR